MPHPPYHGRAFEHPEILERVQGLLEARWDPDGTLRRATGAPEFLAEQARAVLGMLAAGARETELQRYLRQTEQAALGESLHPFEARRELAAELWRAARSL